MTWKRASRVKNSTSSWKKEPKLPKWSPASPRPQGRPRPQPRTPLAGRSQNGQRTPSSPCELVCGSAPQTAGHLPSPRSTRGTGRPSYLQSPRGPVPLCLHGNAPRLLPGLPLVGTSFRHLLSGEWDGATAAGGSHACPRPSCPQAPSARVSSLEKQAVGPFAAETPGRSCLRSPSHREGGRTPGPSPTRPAPACLSGSPWTRLPSQAPVPERACLHLWAWSPSLECCSLTRVTLWHLACSAL